MKFLPLVFLLLLLSCADKNKVPDGLLPVPEMTDVLWDVMLADELVSRRYLTDTSGIKTDTSLLLYQQIAKAHHTTQQQFKKSLQFYETRPDLFQGVIDTLQKRSMITVYALPKDTLP